ncbi:MAG: hypothetical protein RI932_277 [Pseudomonadota bacterium]|jgi:hypothetical protein
MQATASKINSIKRLLATLLAGTACCASAQAWAGSWGMLLGYNNPAGSKLGLNFLYQGAPFGFEVGVGDVDETKTASGEKKGAVIWGDVDIKYYPSVGLWRPFLEGGLTYSVGIAGSERGLAAGSPFAGGGILYSGSTVLFHIGADYKINERVTYPSAGFGFRL